MVEGSKSWTLWEKWNKKGACECIEPADPNKAIPGMYPDKSRKSWILVNFRNIYLVGLEYFTTGFYIPLNL